MVLPGHNLPFVGLGTRIDELCAHHEARCVAIETACRRAPCTAADLVPVVFRRVIDDPHQMGFAFSEGLAHGVPAEPRVIAGSASESIFQPEWSPDGARLAFVSDRSGWWNLYDFDLAARTTRALAPMAAEFGAPQWIFGMT